MEFNSNVNATNTRLINGTCPYFNREIYTEFNKQVETVGRDNISKNFKNKIEALGAETDLYECNEYEVAVLTGAPLWRLRDFRSMQNNHYPFKKLRKKPDYIGKTKVKRDVSKVVYPLGLLKTSLSVA